MGSGARAKASFSFVMALLAFLCGVVLGAGGAVLYSVSDLLMRMKEKVEEEETAPESIPIYFSQF